MVEYQIIRFLPKS